MAHDVGVVLRLGVGVGEFDGQRGARRAAVVDARDNLRQVGFAARRGPGGSAAAACEVLGEIRLRKGNPGRDAVH